jgi:hypothetical protein
MLNAIPNPQKSFQIEKSTLEINEALKNLCLYTKEYKIFKENELLSLFIYEASEFLSIGVYIDVNFSSVSENKTEVKIEVRRKVGTFNQSFEVTQANQHLIKIAELLSLSLKSDHSIILDKQAKELEERRLKDEKANQWAKDNPILVWSGIVLMTASAIGIFYYIYLLITKQA